MYGYANTSNLSQDLDAASSESELPVKVKLSLKERPAAVGREAALQKQLQEAVKDRQDLLKRYEVKDQKCDELRDKLKVTKAALSSRERELGSAQRMLQKLGQEKNQLRDETAEHKVYVRKLEARLDELKNAAEISSRYLAVKQKASDLQHQLVSVTSELEASKDVAAERQKEIDRYIRALEVRASELSQEAGGQDIPAKLLYSLAESREESLELAKQLAATKAEMHKLRQSAARLSSRVDTAELMRADAEVAAEQLKQRLEKLLGTSQEVTKSRADMAQLLVAARGEAETYKSERDELAEVVLEMQEELEQLKAAAAEAKANAELAAAAAANEAMSQVANSHAAAQGAREQQLAREAQLSKKCTQLAEHASQLETALQQQLQSARQTATGRQQQIMVLESQLTNRRQRELELERQVAELQSQTKQLGGAVSSAEAAASRTTQLEQQVVRLEASLRVASVERQQLEQRLKQAGDDAVAQQQEMLRELDGIRVQLAAKEAAHRCAMEDVAALQKQLDDAVNQLDKTATAKADLQHNMLSQITNIKEKLQIAEQQSQQQLLSPGSPIFPFRHSSSTNTHSSAPRRSSNRVPVRVDDDATGPAAAAAAALAAAKARIKHGPLAARRGPRAASPHALAGSGRAVGWPGAQVLSAQSARSVSSRSATTQHLHLKHAGQRLDDTTSGMSGSRAAGGSLAAAAAARVAQFAAELHATDTISSYRHQQGPERSGAGPSASNSNTTHLSVLGRSGNSLAMHPTAGSGAAGANAALLRRSLDNSSLLRPGSIYGSDDKESSHRLQRGRHTAVSSPSQRPGVRLTSPTDPYQGASSTGGIGPGQYVQGSQTSPGVYRPANKQQQGPQQQQINNGLADQIDGMSWLDILKADSTALGYGRLSASPQRPKSQVAAVYDDSVCDGQYEEASPYRQQLHHRAAEHSSGERNQMSAGSNRALTSNGYPSPDSRVTAQSSLHEQHNEQQEIMQGSRHVVQRHSASPGAVSDNRSAPAVRRSPADYHAVSRPAEAAGSRPQSATAAAEAAPSNLSWLQQPMEPYSPTVAAAADQGLAEHPSHPAVQRATVGGVTAAGRSRGDELADPYSLPGSTEESAVSLLGVGGMQGPPGGAGVAGGAVGSSMKQVELMEDVSRSRSEAWQVQEQQQQQVAKQYGRSAGGHGGTSVQGAAGSAVGGRQLASMDPKSSAGERWPASAAVGSGSRASDLLHACGAWEVTLDSDTNTDDHQDSDKGCSNRDSSSSCCTEDRPMHGTQQYEYSRHAREQRQRQSQMAVGFLKQPGTAVSPRQHSPSSPAACGGLADSPRQQQQLQQQVRFTDAAASLCKQQSKLEATRAALRQLSSKRQSAFVGAEGPQSPRFQAQAASNGHPQSLQSREMWVTQAAAVRASLDLQQQRKAASRAGSSKHGRRVSDDSSSGSNRHGGASAAQLGRTQSMNHGCAEPAAAVSHRGAAVNHRGAAVALLSPPSTGKVDAVLARRSGMGPLPMQDLEGDATCCLKTSSSRLSAALQQRQQQQCSREQGHWPEGGVPADSSRQSKMSGHRGRHSSERGGGNATAMNALLAKLSEGEPTLQDLAELEDML